MKKVAVVGYGIVGGGVADILVRNAKLIEQKAGEKIELGYIVDLRDFPGDAYENKITKDFSDVENDEDVAVVVEAIGGCGAALTFCRKALEKGKSVVTSNKQLVAEHGLELIALAQEHDCNFLFEASVGGGIPVLHPLNQCLDANVLSEVTGILNGTTNYILTQMLENSMSYADALSQAQKLGYAEQNPAADVEGIDAGRKACILADMAFGKNIPPEAVSMRGITEITPVDALFAAAGGMKIKLLGRAVRNEKGTFVFVCPHFVPSAEPLASVSDVFNAVEVKGSEVGTVMFYGPGAGRFPTASAVVGDVIDIVRHPGRRQPITWVAGGEKTLCSADDFESRFFVRTTQDRAETENRLGAIEWLPDQGGVHGGFTAKTTRKAIAASGAKLDAVWPILA